MSSQARSEILERVHAEVRNLFGGMNATIFATTFARDFYISQEYYEYMTNLRVDDIEGVTFMIFVTSAQMFLTVFDFTKSVHDLLCTDTPTSSDFSPVALSMQESMKKFLDQLIRDVIKNARKLDEPKEWLPELRPVINEIITERFENTMIGLKAIGHDCNNCHIYSDKKECSIYGEIPKPFGYLN